MRGDADNPFVSPRREAENLVKQFQNTIPGQKGPNIMKTKGGKYVNYDPTRVRQGDDMGTGVVGAFSMKGQSKKFIRDMDKNLKSLGKKSDDARSILKNIDGNKRINFDFPDAKILVIFREPVSRCWSNYKYSVENGIEKREFSEVIKN